MPFGFHPHVRMLAADGSFIADVRFVAPPAAG